MIFFFIHFHHNTNGNRSHRRIVMVMMVVMMVVVVHVMMMQSVLLLRREASTAHPSSADAPRCSKLDNYQISILLRWVLSLLPRWVCRMLVLAPWRQQSFFVIQALTCGHPVWTAWRLCGIWDDWVLVDARQNHFVFLLEIRERRAQTVVHLGWVAVNGDLWYWDLGSLLVCSLVLWMINVELVLRITKFSPATSCLALSRW